MVQVEIEELCFGHGVVHDPLSDHRQVHRLGFAHVRILILDFGAPEGQEKQGEENVLHAIL